MDGTGKSTRAHGLLLIAGAVLLMAIEWIVLVAGTQPHEMIVGAASVSLSAMFLIVVHGSNSLRLEFRWIDVINCWRIPWYVVSGVYEILLILFKDLFKIHKADSFYRVSGFETSKCDPVMSARRVLAIAYTTVAPNFIVIGIDYEQGRMLFHQLERSSVPKMTQSLGAQP